MAERLIRATEADLEVRADGRTVVGIAVPFDQPTEIRDAHGAYTEVFRRGAFRRTIAERGPGRIKFLAQHDRQALPIGRASVLREDPEGLYAELHASDTASGADVITLIRDGALDGLSIGFTPERDQWNTARTSVERLSVKLHEISAVAFAAYSGAVISGVRAADLDPSSDRERWLHRLRLQGLNL